MFHQLWNRLSGSTREFGRAYAMRGNSVAGTRAMPLDRRFGELDLQSRQLLHQAFEQTLKGRREFESLDLQATHHTLRILESLTRLVEEDPRAFFRLVTVPLAASEKPPSGSQTLPTAQTLAGSAAAAIGEVFDFLKAQKEYWAGRDDTAQGSLEEPGGVEKPDEEPTTGETGQGGGSTGQNGDSGETDGGESPGNQGGGGNAPDSGARLGGGVVTLPDGSVGIAGTAHGAPEGSTVEILDPNGNKIGEIPNATDANGRFSGFFPPGGPLGPGTEVSLKVGDAVLPVGPIPAPVPISF